MEIRFTDGSYTDGGERIMLDPTVYPDWQIGAAAERALPPVEEFRRRMGLLPEEQGGPVHGPPGVVQAFAQIGAFAGQPLRFREKIVARLTVHTGAGHPPDQLLELSVWQGHHLRQRQLRIVKARLGQRFYVLNAGSIWTFCNHIEATAKSHAVSLLTLWGR